MLYWQSLIDLSFIQNLALMSRLTEEKNAAIKQNSKLRQELVSTNMLKFFYCLIPVVKDNNCKQACSVGVTSGIMGVQFRYHASFVFTKYKCRTPWSS
ncbi:hypothetical protein B296_00014476 [Ensete ventricosum]|uniref:Uncharacterized protein n=1 Tax=Ensete ventricosum TaxID=4639 RepID=A0A427A3T3_ENSVE|nr:hypothetical protein B296_00014476 [Ensete ventricosum]